MSRSRRYQLTAAALLLVAVGAVAFASHTKSKSLGGGTASGDGNPAPALTAVGWINTKPLMASDLKGKVVVYDFWTYSCVNCVRTIPYVRGWYDRYGKDGLVVVGVHSPEFDFEQDHGNVRRAVKKLGVDYPVALDDDMTIWDAFNNQYWPADYIYDREGKQASVHFGEGDYDSTENEIRKLLGVPASAPRSTPHGHEGGTAVSTDLTAETYNGLERGQDGFASNEPLVAGQRTYTARTSLEPGDHALAGRWRVSDQYVEAQAAGASIVLRYHAAQVNLVLTSAGSTSIPVMVQVDGRRPVTVTVKNADLYPLVSNRAVGTHTVRVTATAPGLRAFAFTFGG